MQSLFLLKTKKTPLWLVLLFAFFTASGQEKSKPEPAGPGYPEGYTKTITVSINDRFTKNYRIEYSDKEGILRKSVEWASKIEGDSYKDVKELTPSGDVTCRTIYYRNDKGELNKIEVWSSHGHTIWEKGSDGAFRDKNGYKQKFTPLLLDKELKKEFEELEKDHPDLKDAKTPCENAGTCQPKSEIFVGYSVLNGDRGTDNEFFPVGVHASAVFFLNDHIAVGPDASIHTKKDGDQTLTRGFVLGKFQYNFGNTENCDKKVQLNGHILAGICFEKFKYEVGGMNYGSKGSGFAFGGGFGVNFRISDNFRLGVNADIIAVKFKNTDELNINTRGSVLGTSVRFHRNIVPK